MASAEATATANEYGFTGIAPRLDWRGRRIKKFWLLGDAHRVEHERVHLGLVVGLRKPS
jgi:hypothetical protein